MKCCGIYFIIFAFMAVILQKHDVTAAPNINFSSCSRPEDASYYSPLSFFASKAMGAVIKCASLACQYLPIPDFVKLSKPKLTIGKSPDFCAHDEDISFDFDD